MYKMAVEACRLIADGSVGDEPMVDRDQEELPRLPLRQYAQQAAARQYAEARRRYAEASVELGLPELPMEVT